MYGKSHAEIICRVRDYFENELRQGKRMKLSHVVERTAAATGVSKNIICRLKSTKDLENRSVQSEAHIVVKLECSVPEKFDILVRKTVRDLFLEKKQMPSLKRIFAKINSL